MKKILFIPLMAICLLVGTLAPKPASAEPAFLFVATLITGGWAASTFEECKEDGLDAKECAKRTWRERTDVPITQAVYKERFND